MGTKRYKVKDGTVVPGVTTIIGACYAGAKNALIHWAWKQGMDGKDYRKTRDEAAGAGTLAHTWTENYDKGEILSPPPKDMLEDMLEKARNGHDAYVRWRESTKYEIVLLEQPLVSETYRYGGTFDRLFRLGNNFRIGDIKTTSDTYADHLIQVAAYINLVRENYPEFWPVIGADLIRFGRSGSFHHSSYNITDLTEAWAAFKLLRQLYDLQPEIEKLV